MSAINSVSSMLNSRTRMSGMVSGLDVDSLVSKLMQVETARVDKVKQQKQILEWQKDAYRSITTAVRSLKDKYMNLTSSTNLSSQSAFQKTIAASSNTAVATVSGGAVGSTSHTVQVDTLSSVGAVASSTAVVAMAGKQPADVLLTDLGLTEGADILSISGVATAYKAGVGQTVQGFMDTVNKDANNTAYKLSYNSATQKFVVTSKSSGVNTATVSGSFLSSTNLTAASSDTIKNIGTDASYTLDGIPGYTSKTNTIQVDNMTVTMLSTGATNISASKDIDGMVSNIKAFITDYNTMLSTVTTKLSEKKYRDYLPLTDEQKSAMKDADIKLWNDKAQSGLLANDDLLSGMSDRMRSAFSSAYNVNGIDTTLSSIGIGTTSYQDKGVLTIDETKLRAALTSDPDKVMGIFTQSGGLLETLGGVVSDYTRTTRDAQGRKGLLLEKAGISDDVTDTNNMLQDMINEKDTTISDLMDKLSEKEDYYYSRFSQMETAISNMNSQSSWLSQQLGGSNG